MAELKLKVPPKGHTHVRLRVRAVHHGANIEILIRKLGSLSPKALISNLFCGVFAGAVGEDLDVSDINDMFDEAKEQFFSDQSTDIWHFDPDG